jgi:endonuclease/exonuclease/phosphatase family metal-dependent hydrolase
MNLRVATLNVYYHSHNRLSERMPLLAQGLAALAPAVFGLQEVDRGRDVDRSLAGDRYDVWRAVDAPPARYPRHWDASSLLVARSAGKVEAHSVARLTHKRVVQRVLLRTLGGARVCIANTHFHHADGHPGKTARLRQARDVVRFLDAEAADATVLLGDLNGETHEPFFAALTDAGYRSAYATVHGREPERTFPSGLISAGMSPEPAVAIDYVLTRGAVEPIGAQLAWCRPSERDDTLFPSDHFGVAADLVLTEHPRKVKHCP